MRRKDWGNLMVMRLPTPQIWRDHLNATGLAQNDALGRRVFLEGPLARESLFLTEVFEAKSGTQARVNVLAEVEGL